MLIDRLLFSDKTPILLQKSLDFQSQRQLLIASNISNIDTPGYKAKDIDFKGTLKTALGRGEGLPLAKTHSGHIGPGRAELRSLKAEPFVEPDAAKSNGNNVNIDKEMMKLAENQIAYSATAQLLTKRGSTIRAAISENAQA
ncbi:MAG: flagellar basal body rod protein FlgB [Nitrospinaceae bacterium]|nr:flagellar basal body rod protein FlgB [Nitrospinaceae bacterium]NIR54942.1 flagellar basal body rod protein FlgB [Nitrospinaceae bacterium]NIT82184.1 flagellar basal body rod protein FlgB [Nitrospinaceae bacterium]NIX34571.1 flagellar basal body rod protein FlgB [Nitrospinaceae bacterium]NIY15397.1 flagellar basal body rod protein FlgB [Nitrospinaceae bacterium]